jgi:hypothetical protein
MYILNAVFWDVTPCGSCKFLRNVQFLQEPHGVTSLKMAFFNSHRHENLKSYMMYIIFFTNRSHYGGNRPMPPYTCSTIKGAYYITLYSDKVRSALSNIHNGSNKGQVPFMTMQQAQLAAGLGVEIQ